MTYVVTESCIKCKYTDCVDVCPVDCFREGPNFLAIDPDECIDCTLCVAECPVEAIYAEDDVPDNQKQYIVLNAELSKGWKPIVERKPAPADRAHPAGGSVGLRLDLDGGKLRFGRRQSTFLCRRADQTNSPRHRCDATGGAHSGECGDVRGDG